MKNFEQILSDAGVELTDEQKATITKEMGENYKTVADWQKQHDKVQTLEKTLKDTQEELRAFEGVNVEDLNKKINDLTADLETKDKEYQAQIADRDFQDNVKSMIAKYKGKNEKAIKALLDMEALKESKNQNEDLDAAVKALTEAEDSKMLFGEAQTDEEVGEGNPIGAVTKNGGSEDAWVAQMMAAAGVEDSNKK